MINALTGEKAEQLEAFEEKLDDIAVHLAEESVV